VNAPSIVSVCDPAVGVIENDVMLVIASTVPPPPSGNCQYFHRELTSGPFSGGSQLAFLLWMGS